jgi:hypothetical protein
MISSVISPAYRAQVDLLLQVMPHVAKEDCFALKGGTAWIEHGKHYDLAADISHSIPKHMNDVKIKN